MKNTTTNVILALILLITPLTSGSLHANQEANSANAAVTTDKTSSKTPEKNVSLSAFIAELAIIWGSVIAHEGGHALAASFFKPGSVHEFYIGFTGGHVLFNLSNLSSAQKQAIFLAGPLAGCLFAYATAKSADIAYECQKNKNLLASMAAAWKKPLYADPNNIDIQAIKHTSRLNMLIHALNLLAVNIPSFLSTTNTSLASDGLQMLKIFEFPGDYSHVFQASPGKILLWNATFIAGIYAIHRALTHAAQRYQDQQAADVVNPVSDARQA